MALVSLVAKVVLMDFISIKVNVWRTVLKVTISKIHKLILVINVESNVCNVLQKMFAILVMKDGLYPQLIIVNQSMAPVISLTVKHALH